ncbi:BON domain-containing protein [Allochromatium palmeri]|uniref:BON domain-containing protein n=1 Tax=Allochromatium palmeri TaxID=231048 RepID=A0A6N8EIA2_9GAMM|nr:BON domain-containing protein [Allochromatium palmeri]MTW22778.1 BON domain-containing protein [Allochromatium palmeri]
MQEKHANKLMTLSGILVVAACLSASLGLAGCEKEGGAEEVGRKMDQTAERMGTQLEATKASMDEKAERSGNYLEDAAITAKIKAEILGESALKVLQIDVTTIDGVVTLSGTVDSQLSFERATEVARNNQGVKSVENNLVVK